MRTERRRFFESIMLAPNRSAIIFFLWAAVAGIVALPGWHWSHHSLVVILVLIGCCLAGAGVWLAFGDRIAPWGLHASLVITTLMISVAAAIGPSVHEDFAVLYVWTAVFAALYFPAIPASLQIAFGGTAYFVVLLVAHSSLRALVVSWTSIFGTATVLSIVVFGLVSLLRRTSREDPLTGLPNRRSWDERRDEELERALRNHTSLSLAVIDIDNFKAVNDRHGHSAGDRLLCRFADGWSETIRGSGDFVARLGGDEFGVLAPGSDDAGIQGVVERLRRVAPDGVSCTIGTATWDRAETAEDMFRRADEKMYRSKRNWRTT